MLKNCRDILLILFYFCLFLFIIVKPSNASTEKYFSQTTSYIPISQKSVEEGSVISFSPKEYILSNSTYDQFIIGVITSSPAISVAIKGPVPSYPVINSGQSFVRVSTINGKIKKGDLLTSSIIPGVAMKATTNGFILGAALEDFTENQPRKIGKILVNIQIRNNSAPSIFSLNILSLLRNTTAMQNTFFRYFLVAGIAFSTIIFGSSIILRTASRSIEALGRNPLAGMEIHIAMFCNIFMGICILVSGYIMSLVVLKI